MSLPVPADRFGTPAGAAPTPGDLICSARACRRTATYALRWNNPRLHNPERRKVWLACAEHRDCLADFLSMRGLLRDVVAADQLLAPPAAE